MEKKPCRPRWFQFSVRMFLVVVTLFAVWLGWWADRMRRQQAAVETINAAGHNEVYFDYEVDSRTKGPSASSWLKDTFGDVFFRHAVEVRIGGDLAALKDLPYVRTLSLSGLQITDDDLVYLKGLRNLERLDLYGTRGITDEGMRHLADLSSLRRLALHDTKITDAGLLHLKGMQNLKSLQLDTGPYTAKGILELKQALPKLDIPNMDIRPRAVTEKEAVAELAKAGAEFMSNDAGEVADVTLKGPQVTDETTALLDNLKALQRVALLNTQVSYKALQALRARRPELDIFAPGVFEPRPEEADAVVKLQRLGASLSPNDQGFVKFADLCPCELTIADADLELVAGFSQLEWLEIHASEISGAGLKRLAGCAGLRSLRIDSSQVTDDDFIQLQNLTNLKSLTVTFARVHGSGLACLAGLDKLKDLSLSGNPLEDQYLEHFKVLPALRHIDLDRTPISDTGMKHLASCAGLESIMLQYTKVTDEGVSLLLGLEKLKNVAVAGSGVTDAMEQRLPKPTMTIGLPRRPHSGSGRPKVAK